MKRKGDDVSHKQTKKWVIVISVWTFVMAIFFSLITEKLMKNLDVFFAFIILIIIMLLGIVFDIIGIAVAASGEKIFHSMAANKVEEAKYAIKLIKNAGQVSNFCNDVIGDISGIVSGSAGTIIIYNIISKYDIKDGTILSIMITALIASFTVGGKAVGKEIAINNSEKIIFKMAKVLNFLEKNFRIKLFKNQTK